MVCVPSVGRRRPVPLRAAQDRLPFEVLTIRSVLLILLCLILATLVLAGSVVGVLALHEAKTTTTENPPQLDLPVDTIPDPGSRLRPRRVAVDAAARSPQRRRWSCRVRIEGKSNASLFLALFDGESGARLAVRTIATPLPREVEFEAIPTGTHDLRLARDADRAKTSYIASASVTVVDRTDEPTRLSATVRRLRIQLEQSSPLPAGDRRGFIANIPVLLRRRDDPNWRYIATPGTDQISKTDTAGVVEFHGLGPGTYVLSTHGFEPDATEKSRLTIQLEKFDESVIIRGRAQ